MDSLPAVGPGSLPSSPGSDLPLLLKKFYRGEPLALGITQIFTGIIGIIFGLLVNLTDEYMNPYTEIMMPYWSGILYIISGSLAVAAAWKPKLPLVKGMLAMNVISAVTAGIGIICLSITLSSFFLHYGWYSCSYLSDDSLQKQCYETSTHLYGIIKGMLAILTVFTILEFCITISVASFGCKVLCRDSYTQTVVVIYQNVTPDNAEHSPVDCKEPESP
ncbi:membrane-spanning 4-domains subfamily A member 4A-like isoform 1-T5 [Liasis olivaceus]